MSSETTETRLFRVLNESLPNGLDEGTTGATLLSSFGVDSLVLIDLIFDLEQEFGVKLAAEEVMALRTVGDLTVFLEQRAPGR